MNTPKLTGAIAALLDEYRKAINELIQVINPLSKQELLKVIAPKSKNPDCLSIQTILTHVTSSIFSYAVYIENSIGLTTQRPLREELEHADEYITCLEKAFQYTENLFIKNPGIILEELDQSKKINTGWGQQYDVEQLLEHAIVHVLRHRRQIESALTAE